MFDTQAIKENFGSNASQYDKYADLQRAVRRHAANLALQYWPKNGKILDAGCGTGALAFELFGYELYGFDVSPGMCAVAQKHMSNCVNADARQIPFSDNVFDGVFSSLMLQWVHETASVFSEMHRVSKDNGVAVITTLLDGTLQELKDAFAAVDGLPHVSGFAHAADLLQQAEAAGFSLAVAKQDKIVEYYPDTIALMRSLQVIGATNKHVKRSKGLMTPSQFTTLEKAYAEFRQKDGLPATWQVLTLVLRKEAA